MLLAELAGDGGFEVMACVPHLVAAKGSGGRARATGTCTTAEMPVLVVGYGSDERALVLVCIPGPTEPLGDVERPRPKPNAVAFVRLSS